jgi:hypothetical protein
MLRLRLVHQCAEAWGEMRPAHGGRHCAACDQQVIDWTEATEDEARAYLATLRGRTACVRMSVDGRGRPLFAAAMVAALSGCGAARPPLAPAAAAKADVAKSPADAGPETPPPATADDGDDDADGVANSADACPREPGPSTDDPRHNGCPWMGMIAAGPVQVRTAP